MLGRVRTVSATVSADREAERAEFAASLRAEQQHAYKRGDQDAVRRIQRKLDALAPEKADAGPKHPWA